MWKFEKFPNNIAIIDENFKISYLKLNYWCRALSNKISSRSLIFILCSNSFESIVLYVSCIKSHIVPVLLDENMDIQMLKEIFLKYQPEYIWSKKELNEDYGKEISIFFNYKLYRTLFFKKSILHKNLALLLCTSGSTGNPKLVRLGYENLQCNTKSIIEYLKIESTDRTILTLPMYYTFGLSIINTYFYSGACIILSKYSIIESNFWDIFKMHKITSLSGVPYSYEILDKMNFYTKYLPYLKTLTQAGGKLSLELQKKIADYAAKKNIRFFIMYGQTEATSRMAYLPYSKAKDKLGSIGIPVKGGKFFLLNEKKDIIKQNYTIGELVYKGRNVFYGYSRTRKDLIKGNKNSWILHTGDLAYFDEDGYWFIVGRKSRFVKFAGVRISLDDLENHIKSSFQNIDCVICVDRINIDYVHIFINELDQKDNVSDFLIKKFGLKYNFFEIHYIKVIPRTSSGKVLYQKLLKY
ncbi:AMP-binding protein [Campylobacter volucris]|uniref:AMP-binding protein n=1 Tax=Campylobacter volucris TaxID=1031542 RepID=UPI00189EA415|nr:AMP-binding protein [Campylobacter volucris]MBF7068298.1 AMP-binding protein [Campylobacter volucris]